MRKQPESLSNNSILRDFTNDLLISVLIGFLISASICLILISIVGAYMETFFPISIVSKSIIVFFSQNESGDTIFILIFVCLIPMLAAALGVSSLRGVIDPIENHKDWFFLMIANGVIASLVGVFLPIGYIVPSDYQLFIYNLRVELPPTYFIVIATVIVIGLSINIFFLPKKHIEKIISVSIVAGLISGVIEFISLHQILTAVIFD